MQYENTIPKRKISENLFGPREGCVGPDYSASLSHLFLSLNHMHLSFLASDFLHPIGLSDFGMAQVPAQQEDDMSDSVEDMTRRKECPKLKEPDQSLYYGSVQTMPFVRPHFSELVAALDFAIANNYPARGEYTGAV